MNRVVFLDRDGVLNRTIVRNGAAYAPECLEEFEILPDAGEAVTRLRRAGLLAIVVTNQPEIARGTLSWEDVAAMHKALQTVVPVDDVFLCPHIDADGCSCRKPKPGLLLAAAQKWCIDLQKSFLIGDRWRDVGAGQAVGCYTVLIDQPYSGTVVPKHRARSLSDAVSHILEVIAKEVRER